MEIKVTRVEDGPAKVEVVNPSTGETLSCTDVNVGQEVVVALPNAHAPEDVQVGEVSATATEEPGETDGGEPGGGETQEPGGEAEGAGGGTRE